ncbi:hypothetical protein SBOR_7572 [Sclerotinia borealis F-4128]|uniref:Uncharacterized protein n=1 Tax=Sclerotinia borealis (strain F-4128) TaxID=1432307 RepID=W9C5K8_SCLBF|nr:hypothetical protein SBOR_7572 [Sclerotinia borealis F-4128]
MELKPLSLPLRPETAGLRHQVESSTRIDPTSAIPTWHSPDQKELRLPNISKAASSSRIPCFFSSSTTLQDGEITKSIEIVEEEEFEPSPGPRIQPPAVRARPPGPIHKQLLNIESSHESSQIADTFQYETLPDIPLWNKSPKEYVPERTPLFIGFTRNWPLLQQCILSYITAGWPADDTYVVDNTGTMKSNFIPKPNITLQTPSYLNVDRVTNVFGVKVIFTPNLLTFAQLQNFYIYTALENDWENYFWSHMDVVVFSEEDLTHAPLNQQRNPATSHKSLFVKMGGCYSSDCDMYQRLGMAGIIMDTAEAGWVMDVGRTIDLNPLFRRKYSIDMPPTTAAEMNKLAEDNMGGESFKRLINLVQKEAELKNNDQRERNSWQQRQSGGHGELFYRDPRGFEQALEILIRSGDEIYLEKWGHIGFDLRESGLKLDDAWMVEHDWE